MTESEQYIPGVCNIGPKEVAKRRTLGWIGLTATMLLWMAFAVLKTAAPWRLLLFVAASLAALGFLQAHWHFCVKYGFEGAFKFGPKSGQPDIAERDKFRRLDRRTSVLIIGCSALAGFLVTLAACLFPM